MTNTKPPCSKMDPIVLASLREELDAAGVNGMPATVIRQLLEAHDDLLAVVLRLDTHAENITTEGEAAIARISLRCAKLRDIISENGIIIPRDL